MSKKRIILFTGGTGFLGNNILHKIVGGDFQVSLLLRTSSRSERLKDINHNIQFLYLEKTDLPALFKENRIDTIVHCATNYGRGYTPPLNVLDANLILPLKLLQLGAENGLRRFINTDTILDKGVSYYSLSKSQFREWLRVYSDRLACVNVELEHFYGPGDDKSKFVTWLISALLRQEDHIDLTSGGQRRDFIYIDDVVNAFVRIIDTAHAPGFLNYQIGSGTSIPIRDFVKLVARITGNTKTKLNFGAVPYRKNEVMNSRVDVSAIMALGWSLTATLEQGISKTVDSEKGRL